MTVITLPTKSEGQMTRETLENNSLTGRLELGSYFLIWV